MILDDGDHYQQSGLHTIIERAHSFILRKEIEELLEECIVATGVVLDKSADHQ